MLKPIGIYQKKLGETKILKMILGLKTIGKRKLPPLFRTILNCKSGFLVINKWD
jgi:hypothetical protein